MVESHSGEIGSLEGLVDLASQGWETEACNLEVSLLLLYVLGIEMHVLKCIFLEQLQIILTEIDTHMGIPRPAGRPPGGGKGNGGAGIPGTANGGGIPIELG